MKKFLNILYSTRLMAVLFFLFAIAMGVATFIENDFGTQTSKALIYNAWWFEAIMVFFVINFFGNIFRYRLHKKEKWPVLMFHLSFIFILIGAGITRYYGYEGLMLINEGETTNKFLSETTYVNFVVDDNKDQLTKHEKIMLSAWGSNNWDYDGSFRDTEYSIKLAEYIPWAEEKMIQDDNGVAHLFLVESTDGSRHEHYIKKGTIENIHGILVGFDVESENVAINFKNENNELKIVSNTDGEWLKMADQSKGKIIKDSLQTFNYLSLHNVAGLQFVIPRPAEKGELKTVRGPKDDKKFDIILLDVSVGEETKQIELLGGKFNSENSKSITVGGLNFRILYGSKILETPFDIKLNDFQLEKYPGSESAAAFSSEVTVIDSSETFDYRIFMNNILDYKGYKFFQASYDLSGEVEQTHLSVNHDFWGTFFTYVGYSFLYTGLICILFAKHTRFDYLKKSLNKIRRKKKTLMMFVGLLSVGLTYGQHQENHQTQITNQQIDSILQENLVNQKHSDSFNKLVIQDRAGRMKPAHTFASELLRKVHHEDNFNGLSPSQVLLSIIENPRFWIEVPIIYLEEGNDKIREILDLPKDAEYSSISRFYTPQGKSKIGDLVNEAQKNNVKNKFQKDIIKIEERIWILSRAISGNMLRIYPIPNDENNKWVSLPEISQANFKGTDSVFVKQSLKAYIQLLQESKQTGDYTQTNKILDGIKKFQQKYGADVYPSQESIELEIAYNKTQPFLMLSKYYGYASLLLIVFVIVQIFKSRRWINVTVKILVSIVIALFIFHTLGLGARWYISGNAPWSNAYESIIYVAWATMLFGLFFGRKSALTITATTFLTAIILAFAHQNWLDPEIANLQPVLNSWWLLVHVSIIVASYGPFSLSMILGIFALFLMIFTTKENKEKMDINIKEITIINEMSLTIGLIMLVIGNFLGGMWANESWGRYWGWDPKETWALVSIMIYAFVLHMRLIPGLRGRYTFNLWSIIAYAAIMMTYFGVNFYLSGLHSYASGDKVITPTSIYYSVAFVLILGIFSWFKYKKYYKK